MDILALDFHDASILAIRMSKGGDSVALEIETRDRGRAVIQATGLKGFRATDVGMQNVLSRGIFSRSTLMSSRAIGEMLDWLTSGGDGVSYLNNAARQRYSAEILSGELELAVLEPSVGAEIVLLCTELTARDSDTQETVGPFGEFIAQPTVIQRSI